MNRILIISTVPSTLRAFLLPFARHFAALGWRVDAMARGIKSCGECRAAFHRTWDVDWTRNPLDPNNLVKAPRRVCEVVRRGRYDLVHIHTPVAAFVSRFALRHLRNERRLKVVYTSHGFHFHGNANPLRNGAFLSLERLAGRWTDALVVINKEDERGALRHRIVPPELIHRMPGIGVDVDRYAPDSVPETAVAHARAEIGLAPGDPLFLMVGEFIRRKRHEDVLRAFTAMPQGAHLALAGDGPLAGPMRQLAAELGIADRVHFLGFRRDAATLMRAATAVVLPSEQEGLPRSVMEALCLEAPVIGSEIRGTRELLEGGCGLLVPVGAVDRLSSAMRRVLDAPAEAQAMGRRGRVRMCNEGYDEGSILKRHEDLYAEVLGLRRPMAETVVFVPGHPSAENVLARREP